MKALEVKLWRDLWQMKTQALAIALVIASGVAAVIMSLCVLHSLEATQQHYYAGHRFADAFAQCKRAPNSLAARIAGIPGVAAVQTRVVMDVTLDVAGMIEPAVGRLISLQDASRSRLNAVHLRAGRTPERGGEVLLNEPFAQANKLLPGDSVFAILNGKLQPLRITGIALSPEYIYQIRPGELFPDDRRFGVFWMGYKDLATAFNMFGAFNDVAIAMAPGADSALVLRRLDELLAPFGGQGAFLRRDQTSHRLVSDELTQLRAMAWIPSAIFLAVAAFILHVVLNRLISTQREQIATLKAFGYYRAEIVSHFLKLALLIVCLGVVIGTAAGVILGRDLTELYSRFFRFPELHFRLGTASTLSAAAISMASGVAGAWGAVRSAARLQPAEAMRPEAPGRYRPTVLERLGLQRSLSQIPRMVLRNIERQPLRSLLSALGLALAIGIVMVGTFVRDIVDFVVELQFYTAQRYDLNVVCVEPASGSILHDLQRLPGVLQAEPYRLVPARLHSGHRSRRLGVFGLNTDASLFRLIDTDQRLLPLAPSGLVVSSKLAELLRVRPGDSLRLEVLERDRPQMEVRIAGVLRDVTGTSAYIRMDELNRLLREGPVVSGAFLKADTPENPALFARLKQIPAVASVTSQRAAVRSFRDTMSANLLRMRMVNVTFASIIAVGIVYNSARIALSERRRELATMRVLGFTRREVSSVFLGEIFLLILAAVPLGLLAGYGLAAATTAGLETETQRFPLVISSATCAFAVVVVCFAALLSTSIVRRRIDRLDLVSVLKAND